MESPFLLHTLFQPKNMDSLAADLGSDDPVYKKHKLMESEFSDLVDVMRQNKWLPLPSINALMTLLWRVVGNHIAPVAINPNVPTLSFWCEFRSVDPIASLAVIMIPDNWHDMLVEDAHMQMGAMVFAASQAKDYWNHKFSPPNAKKEIHDRAWSSEAELLHYFAHTAPDFKPNDYQNKIMDKYPKGIASIEAHYVGREYDGVFPPFPPFPVDVNSFR